MGQENFDKIRSYTDNEVNEALHNLVKDSHFISILKKIFKKEHVEDILHDLRSIRSIHEFQTKYISDYAKGIIKSSIRELTYNGIENIKPDGAYLFVSSHRDIVLDSALMNEILHRNKIQTSEIAIGGNLLVFPWIETLVKLNRSFIVRRDLQGKEMLAASQKLSRYIRKKITQDNTSVWIAQREGRTKNGSDETQISLLKMLNMSGEKNLAESFKELNIMPLSISYEYETCISQKVKEVYARRKGIPYKKTKEDDLRNMGEGLYGKKGHVHLEFGKVLNKEFDGLDDLPNNNKRLSAVKTILDTEIRRGFRLYPSNYIAHDLFYGKDIFFRKGKYKQAQLNKFKEVAELKTQKLEGEKAELKSLFYEIYAMPLENKLLIQKTEHKE